MWDKLGRLSWFWQFLSEGLSSFNPKRFYDSHTWSRSLYESRTSFCTVLISRKFWILVYVFEWLYVTQRLTTTFSINPLIHLYVPFFVLFHLTQMRLSQYTHLLMYLYLEALTSIKDWLIYSGGTDRPGERCYNFFYLKWSYSDGYLSYLDPWLLLSQPFSFGFISFFWC